MSRLKITRIEWGCLSGQRPRKAGSNARIPDHGRSVQVPIARLTADDGTTGFGWSQISRDDAVALVAFSLDDAFDPNTGVRARFRGLDFPVWDLAGRVMDQPVYALVRAGEGPGAPFSAPCYDTSLYMNDLDLDDDDEGAERIAAMARTGAAAGHRAFKIKVGRGARHMPLEAGTRRDIRVIRSVREAVGPDAVIMLDANNGYNLNLTRCVLSDDRGCELLLDRGAVS